jgi:hypothetical protein
LDTKNHILVDLDGTLAYYDGPSGGEVGRPIQCMVERVRSVLDNGGNVKIFTARAAEGDPMYTEEERQLRLQKIEEWCLKTFGKKIEITATKTQYATEIWDDRAVAVESNTGRMKSFFKEDKNAKARS